MYDAHSLHHYVCVSGDTRDPVTRQNLERHERMRLSRVCKRELPSTDHLNDQFIEEVARRELLRYLTDEFLSLPVAFAFEVLANIHQVAHPEELDAVYSEFERRGVSLTRDPWTHVPGWDDDAVSVHRAGR